MKPLAWLPMRPPYENRFQSFFTPSTQYFPLFQNFRSTRKSKIFFFLTYSIPIQSNLCVPSFRMTHLIRVSWFLKVAGKPRFLQRYAVPGISWHLGNLRYHGYCGMSRSVYWSWFCGSSRSHRFFRQSRFSRCAWNSGSPRYPRFFQMSCSLQISWCFGSSGHPCFSTCPAFPQHITKKTLAVGQIVLLT